MRFHASPATEWRDSPHYETEWKNIFDYAKHSNLWVPPLSSKTLLSFRHRLVKPLVEGKARGFITTCRADGTVVTENAKTQEV